MNLEAILNQLDGVKRKRDGWVALCPAHADKNPSLSIREYKGKIRLHCFAGCKLEDICKSIGIDPRDLFAEASPSQDKCNLAMLTVEQYAEAKRLPIEFLKNLGVSTVTYQGRMVVRIPYLDETGSVVAVRFRMALTKSSDDDNRFRWKHGSKPHLYGLWRKPVPDYRILCEGESDCHTLWHHGFPALGVPGAANWNEGRDAAKLDGCARIYVVIEPDKGGAAAQNWLAKSKILDRAYLLSLDGFKDPSALYLNDPVAFNPSRFVNDNELVSPLLGSLRSVTQARSQAQNTTQVSPALPAWREEASASSRLKYDASRASYRAH